jgi:hypothetical protein
MRVLSWRHRGSLQYVYMEAWNNEEWGVSDYYFSPLRLHVWSKSPTFFRPVRVILVNVKALMRDAQVEPPAWHHWSSFPNNLYCLG